MVCVFSFDVCRPLTSEDIFGCLTDKTSVDNRKDFYSPRTATVMGSQSVTSNNCLKNYCEIALDF